jgi:hypothetical protein
MVRLRSLVCANCEATGSRFTPEMSSYRLPVSGKAVIRNCPVLHESMVGRCSLSGESVADHSLGKEENRSQFTVHSSQFAVHSSQFSVVRDQGTGRGVRLWNGR